MQAVITCVVCGDKVRRDDNPLAKEHEHPRRMALHVGSRQVHAADYCDVCFVDLLENVKRTESLFARPRENEGGQ